MRFSNGVKFEFSGLYKSRGEIGKVPYHFMFAEASKNEPVSPFLAAVRH